jgi:hypothetical protein
MYREPEHGEQFVIGADPAEARDYCAAACISKKHLDVPLIFNMVLDSSQFGYDLYNIGKYLFDRTGLWPKLAVERNVGQATIYVLKNLNYPNLFRMVDFTGLETGHESGQYGWQTTGALRGGEVIGTRRKMLDDFALILRQGLIKIYDEQQIRQLKSFVVVKGGKAQARANTHDDLVMATCIAWQAHLVTPIEYLDEFDKEEFEKQRQRWRFK